MRQNKMLQPKDTKNTTLRLLRTLSPYKIQMVFVMIMMMISSLAMVASSFFLKPLVNDYILPGDFDGLFQMLVLLGLIYILGAVFSYWYSRIMLKIAQEVIYNIRKKMFRRMQRFPLVFFDTHAHGDLMSRYTNDVDNLNEAISNSILNLLSSFITLVGTVIAMIILSPPLFIVTAVTIITMLFVGFILGKKSKKYYQQQQIQLGALNGYIEETIKWQKVVKVFRYEERSIDRFNQKNVDLQGVATGAQAYSSSMMPTMENLSHFGYATICIFGGLLAVAGSFDIGTLVAYLQYSRQLSGPIGRATQQINSVFLALAGAERIFELIDTEEEVYDGEYHLVTVEEDENGQLYECEDNRCLKWAWKRSTKDHEELIPLRGEIVFEHVTFGYEKDVPVLKDVSFYAKPGQKIAFVGSTGAGKTTIMNLITRFYEIDQGRITYDGIDIREIDKSSLRRSFGMVLQDVHLFTGSVKENIRYGSPTASDAEIEEAARLANADSFIQYLPKKYDTILESGGSDLSQGERQLLSIARAAAHNPPVLILDEATSSIDTRTEKIIQNGMDNLMSGRTVLVIAHRLSTIQDAKAIMVMEHGEIIERGDHTDLLAQKGRYYELHTGKAKLD